MRVNRTQADDLGDTISAATVVTFGPSMTRQEFAAEADVNTILKRYGMPQRGQQTFGVRDDRIDLQSALYALEAAKEAQLGVPEELRRKYPTWRHVLAACETGNYQQDLSALEERREAEKAKQAQPVNPTE